MKRSIRYAFPALAFLFVCYGTAHAQATISGPTCVVPGTLYQYVIAGIRNATATMQVCVGSGRFADSSTGNNCIVLHPPVIKVMVIWSDSATNSGSLALTSSQGNSTINVTFSPPLLPGSIDSASAMQMVGYDSITPLAITCSPDSGGSCSPVYKYQWQRSIDRVNWRDIPSGDGQSLRINSPVTRSTYYRRKVTEINSGSVGYSTEAAVFLHIDAVLPDSTRQAITDSANTATGLHQIRWRDNPQFFASILAPGKLAGTVEVRIRTFFRKPNEPLFHA